jgi:hypothetical protein
MISAVTGSKLSIHATPKQVTGRPSENNGNNKQENKSPIMIYHRESAHVGTNPISDLIVEDRQQFGHE